MTTKGISRSPRTRSSKPRVGRPKGSKRQFPNKGTQAELIVAVYDALVKDPVVTGGFKGSEDLTERVNRQTNTTYGSITQATVCHVLRRWRPQSRV